MSDENTLTVSERSNPQTMLQSAINQGYNPEGVKILAEIYERWEAKEAEKAFNQALLLFQEECPAITKSQRISFVTKKGGNFESKFAPLPATMAQIRPLLRKHGFVVTFNSQRQEKQVSVICKLSHSQGHTTETRFEIPNESAPLISDAHSAASAVSFAERYSLQLALGLVPQVDDDGKTAFVSKGVITAQQAEQLAALVKETDSNNDAFWNFAGVSELDALPASDFNKVHQALLTRKKRMEEAKKGGAR